MKRIYPSRRRLWWYFGLSVVLLVVTALMAANRTMSASETSVFRHINNLSGSLRLLFLILTQAGSAWMLFGVTLLLLALSYNRDALRVFCSGAAAFGLAQLLVKHLVRRPRPLYLLASVHVREPRLTDFGFPSAHTAVATAVTLSLWFMLPKKWRWLCWVWIAIVAFSRMYVGAHAPLDVVGGFACGVIVVTGGLLIHGKLKNVTKITHLKLSR